MKQLTLGQKMALAWAGVPPRGCHLGISGEEKSMLERFKIILTGIKKKGKIVIDYGCGGAILGKYLLENCKIKKYIGYDLAEKSIKKANERLKEFDNKEIRFVETHDVDFAKDKPDIICCLACIIHFPNQNYLDRYLQRFNESGAEYLILEIRNKDIGTKFQENVYGNFEKIIHACITEPKYLQEKLTNYEMYKNTDNKTSPTNCQILYFKRLNVNNSAA